MQHPPRPEPKKRKQPTKILWSVKFLESISTGAQYVRTGPYTRNLGWVRTAKSSGLTGRRLWPWKNPQLSETSYILSFLGGVGDSQESKTWMWEILFFMVTNWATLEMLLCKEAKLAASSS
jgi:hypothetical protein